MLRKNSVPVRSLTDPSDNPSARPFYRHRWLTGAAASVGFELVVEMNLVQIGTNKFFHQLVRHVASERPGGPVRTATRNWGDAIKARWRVRSSCPLRGDPFPLVFVMEATENRANHDLAVLRQGMSVVTLQR